MIKIRSYRQCLVTGRMHEGVFSEYVQSVENALFSFLEFELGYGGLINSINEEKDIVTVSVKTRIFNKLDTTYFSGHKDEMISFVQISYLMLHVETECKELLVETAIENLNDKCGVPFYICHAVPLIVGRHKTKIALLCALGAQPNTQLFEELKNYNIGDLCAAWALNDYKIQGIETVL